jgi:uncharacterized C2H2 Zn-finger protein
MDMLKCPQCGREFKNDLALKIHIGRQHGSKAKVKPRKKSRARKARAAAKGAVKCKICGRSFKLPMHLGRHMTFAHASARKGKKPGRTQVRRGRPPRARVGVDIPSLSVDQLISLKVAVDARLAAIARRMRQAKVGA